MIFLNNMMMVRGRSLTRSEIKACATYSLTDHAYSRLKERLDFSKLKKRIQKAVCGYVDNDGVYHIWLQDEVEIVGSWSFNRLKIITIIPMNYNYFVNKKNYLLKFKNKEVSSIG